MFSSDAADITITDTAGPGYEPPAIDRREALTGLLTLKSDPPAPSAHFK